jgi:hypothetical protein
MLEDFAGWRLALFSFGGLALDGFLGQGAMDAETGNERESEDGKGPHGNSLVGSRDGFPEVYRPGVAPATAGCCREFSEKRGADLCFLRYELIQLECRFPLFSRLNQRKHPVDRALDLTRFGAPV